MSEVNEREAIAKALYIELREGNYTYQFVLTPDTVSADKSKVYKSGVCHRRVSHWSPRKNWRFSGAYNHIESYERDPMGGFVQVADKETLDKMANEVIRGFSDSFATLSRRGYVMTKLPIAVEMSEKDCKTFSEYKMSPDLYRRILRSREDLDYPTDVFEAEETTPAPTTTTV